MAVAMAALLAAGCAGGPSLGSLVATGSLPATVVPPAAAAAGAGSGQAPAAPLPAEPASHPDTASTAISLALDANLARVELPPVDVYRRIARHSRGCWFGADAILEASHVFHADAAPPDKGGRVIVTVHERVVGGQSIWGARAFEIALSPAGGATDIAMQNVKFAAERASAMSRDVEAWMHDRAGCALRAVVPAVLAARPPLPVRRPATVSGDKRHATARKRNAR